MAGSGVRLPGQSQLEQGRGASCAVRGDMHGPATMPKWLQVPGRNRGSSTILLQAQASRHKPTNVTLNLFRFKLL